MIPIVLCGGSGTRLWPLINQKVTYKFINNQSLLEMTLNRLKKFKAPFIISVEQHKQNLEKIFKNYKNAQIVYEPFAKDTAVSIALALLCIGEKKEDIVGIFPADHYVDKKLKFQNLLAKGIQIAKRENKIVTLGIPPSHNSSSYGYIKTSHKLKKQAFKATAFIEKPTALKAKTLIKEGSLWNSGIFISPIGLLIQYFSAHLPQLWNEMNRINKNIHLSSFEFAIQSPSGKPNSQKQKESSKKQTAGFPTKTAKPTHNLLHSIYKSLKPISFDKGIMENVRDYLCLPCDVGWTDLGSWEKIAEWNQKFPRKLNNRAKTFEKNSKGNFVFSSEEKHFGLIGIKNQIIINDSKGLLIADRKQLKDINTINKTLCKKQLKGTSTDIPQTLIKKPWGSYQVLMEQEFLKYKKLKVNPKSQLSYQSHKKRAEHWIVIEGSAEVLIEGKIKRLAPNEHIFINQEVRHRLKNPSHQSLIVLEIQIGQCSEEDIIRYKDDYGRV